MVLLKALGISNRFSIDFDRLCASMKGIDFGIDNLLEPFLWRNFSGGISSGEQIMLFSDLLFSITTVIPIWIGTWCNRLIGIKHH